MRALESVLAWVTSDAYAAEDEPSRRNAVRYRALKAFLEQHLRDVKVWRVGTIQVEVYFLGLSPCGAIAGLRTTSIET